MLFNLVASVHVDCVGWYTRFVPLYVVNRFVNLIYIKNNRRLSPLLLRKITVQLPKETMEKQILKEGSIGHQASPHPLPLFVATKE